MNSAELPPDFSAVKLQGFLGFPVSPVENFLALDGDIVLLTGANGAGKSSVLEAITFRETGGTYRSSPSHLINRSDHNAKKFTLRFDVDASALESDDKGQVHSPPPWWYPAEIDRQRHLRVVYFHPLYLERLFEENHGAYGSSFVDIFAPVPSAVDALRDALKKSSGSIEEQISQLQRETGFLTEDEKSQTRRQHAAVFNTRAAAWRESNPLAVGWLADFSAERLVIRSGNLRSTWTGELANLATKFRTKLGGMASEISTSEVSRPAEALLALAAAARLTVVNASVSQRTSTPAEPPPLPPDLATAIAALPDSSWLKAKRRAGEQHQEKFAADFTEKRLGEQRDSVRRLRNALGRGEADFPGWIDELQRRARLWDEILQHEKPPVPLPGHLRSWLQAAAALAVSWSNSEPSWAEWSARLDDEEKRLSFELEKIQAAANERRQLEAIATGLESLVARRGDLRTLLDQADTATNFLTGYSQLENSRAPGRVAAPSGDGAAGFAQACEAWAESERTIEADEERQRDPRAAAGRQRLERLRDLRAAIQAEASTTAKGRLGQLQQDALGQTLAPMEAFLNEAADRFRMFDTIKPVRLERFSKNQDGKRLGLRVGTPPREVGQTSSGQRSQLGMLMFLALHYALRSTYSSRVICLDEVTSSFDLAQIPRLALLLRQIAYAPLSSEFRRRIFIASHNEEFSQRLAEMLTPPDGRTLRIVRFTGYDPIRGPAVDTFRVQPALPFDADRLERYFRYRYGPRRDA
jgi:predicted ATPase